MTNRPRLTRDGAIATTAAAIVLALAGTIAIVIDAWQIAAIGALWAAAALVAGQLADRIRP